MYKLNYLEYSNEDNAEEYVKAYNKKPNTTAKITGELMGNAEIELSVEIKAPNDKKAITKGKLIANNAGVDVYSITKTETIATEED